MAYVFQFKKVKLNFLVVKKLLKRLLEMLIKSFYTGYLILIYIWLINNVNTDKQYWHFYIIFHLPHVQNLKKQFVKVGKIEQKVVSASILCFVFYFDVCTNPLYILRLICIKELESCIIIISENIGPILPSQINS